MSYVFVFIIHSSRQQQLAALICLTNIKSFITLKAVKNTISHAHIHSQAYTQFNRRKKKAVKNTSKHHHPTRCFVLVLIQWCR